MVTTSLADAALENLLALAREAAKRSYSPYSGFRVGAALRLTNGEIVTGTNVENVSYGLTICAERAALVQAVSRFGPEIRIIAVAISIQSPGFRIVPVARVLQRLDDVGLSVRSQQREA